MAIDRQTNPAVFSPVVLGTKFVFRTVEILGREYASVRKPPYEGQVLTVVGFRPRLKNNVVVREPNGNISLMPLYMVEKALNLKSAQTETDEAHSRIRRPPEWGEVGTSVRYRREAVEQLIESCRYSPADQGEARGKTLRARPAQRGGHRNAR